MFEALVNGVVLGEDGVPNVSATSQSSNALVRIVLEVVDSTDSVAVMSEPVKRQLVSTLAIETNHIE